MVSEYSYEGLNYLELEFGYPSLVLIWAGEAVFQDRSDEAAL